jgi:hypothetical protein
MMSARRGNIVIITFALGVAACQGQRSGSEGQISKVSSAETVAALPRAGWVASASQSSGSNVPANAIDNSTSTRWSTGAPQTNGQWFQVDMLVPTLINQITLNATGSNNDYPHGYQVFVSLDGTTWGNAVASGVGTGPVVTISFSMRQARYFKIVQTASDSHWWSIYDLNVFGPSPAFAPVALTRVGWQASANPGNGSARNAIDGSASTRWTTASPQVTSGQYFQVDMGVPRVFTQVTLDTTGSASDYPRGFAVYVSADGVNWGTPIVTGSGTGPVTTITFGWQTARFVRVAQTGSSSSSWSIYEFNVYGVDRPVFDRTGWVATASLTCQSDVPAHVLDGDIATRWSTGVPQANNNQWLQIDMQIDHTFSELRLDSGTSNGDYSRGYSVFVSEDGVNWGNAVATGTGTAQIVTILFPLQTARFIRINQTGTATNWWSVHELNVYGAFPVNVCAQLVPTPTGPPSQTQELQYQAAILSACTAPGSPACQITVRARMNFDFFTAAMLMFGGHISTGQYGQVLRDRDAAMRRFRADASLTCDVAAHDVDGDYVPDDLDACPNTPPLTPVLANGCTNTQVPAGPPAAEVQSLLKNVGVNLDPRCVGAPPPAVPAPLGAWRFPSNPSVGKAIWVSKDSGTSTCPLFYQLEVVLTDGAGIRTVTFPGTTDVIVPGITRPKGAVQFNVHATDAGNAGAWASYSVYTRSYRARAFNAGGQQSAWSAFLKAGNEDCVVGQACADR